MPSLDDQPISAPIPDNFAYAIPVERKEHTDDHPFCWEPDCFWHTDADAIALVKEWYDAGLLTIEQVELIIKGKTV